MTNIVLPRHVQEQAPFGLQGTFHATENPILEQVKTTERLIKARRSYLDADDIRWGLRIEFLTRLRGHRLSMDEWQALRAKIATAKVYNDAQGRQEHERWPLTHWLNPGEDGVTERLVEKYRAVIRDALVTGQLTLEDLPVNERGVNTGMETVLLDDPDVRIVLIGFIYPDGRQLEDFNVSLVRVRITSRLDDRELTLALDGKQGRRREYLGLSFIEIRETMPRLFAKLDRFGLFAAIRSGRTTAVNLTRLVCAAGGIDVHGRQAHHQFELRMAPYGGPPTMDCRFDALAPLTKAEHQARHHGDGHYVDGEAAMDELYFGNRADLGEDAAGAVEEIFDRTFAPADLRRHMGGVDHARALTVTDCRRLAGG